MPADPCRALRRLAPDEVQFQVMLGSLLGDGRLAGAAGERRLRVVHSAARRDYVWWKYDRLATFTSVAPWEANGLIQFETVAHPIFDDLETVFAGRQTRGSAIRRLLKPLGLAVWLSDLGRLELRAGEFTSAQRELALAS